MGVFLNLIMIEEHEPQDVLLPKFSVLNGALP